jgi:hypothetical protein
MLVTVFSALASVLVVGASAQAASIACSGETFGYSFVVRATTAGTKITSKIGLNVSNGSGFKQSGSFTTRSSDIRAGQYLRFSGRSADGASTGTVSADFVSGTTYRGTLSAAGAQGSVDVPVTCSLKGKGFVADPEFESFIESLLN